MIRPDDLRTLRGAADRALSAVATLDAEEALAAAPSLAALANLVAKLDQLERTVERADKSASAAAARQGEIAARRAEADAIGRGIEAAAAKGAIITRPRNGRPRVVTREAIVRALPEDGSPLAVRELAERLEVSPTAMRDAIAVYAAGGGIEVREAKVGGRRVEIARRIER